MVVGVLPVAGARLRYSRSCRESGLSGGRRAAPRSFQGRASGAVRGVRLPRPGVMTLVAGSCRSFPQDSRSSDQIYVVKRMIRGLGVETTLTYSQTLNM